MTPVSILTAFLLFASVAAAQANRIVSGDYAVQVTPSDVFAYRGASQILTMRQVLAKEFDVFRKDQEADMRPCSYERKITIISLAGPYLSVRDNLDSYCHTAAHPNVEERVSLYDLRNGKQVSASGLFPEGALLNALLKDPVLAKHVTGKPANLAALPAALPVDGVPAGNTPCTFKLPEDFLMRIALHHLEAGQIAIRMSLEPLAGACSGITADLGLLLPMPEAIKGERFVSAPAKQPPASIKFDLK